MELKTAADMSYLVACALHGQEPEDEALAEMELPEVYKLAKRHGLAALYWFGLGEKSAAVPEDIQSEWSMQLAHSMFKNEKMRAEREKLYAFLQEKGIRYIPLKGIILEELYPAPGTREMADNDIWFDGNFDGELREYFEARGYTVEDFRISNHDAYLKPPYSKFEMHRAIFTENIDSRWTEYYLDPLRYAVADAGEVGFRFRDSDFYIHVMTHSCKHYNFSGTGMRDLVDCWVMRHAYRLDLTYIAQALEKLGAAEFEQEAYSISEKLFGAVQRPSAVLDALTEAERNTLRYYVSCGRHGNDKIMRGNILRRLSKDGRSIDLRSKVRYFSRYIFPTRQRMEWWCEQNAPFFLRHRWLFWLSPFWRLLTRSFSANNIEQIKKVFSVKEQE